MVLVLLAVAAVGAGAFFFLSGDDDDSASPTGTVDAFLAAAIDDDCQSAVDLTNEAGRQAIWAVATPEEALAACESVVGQDENEFTVQSTSVVSEDESTATVTADLNVTAGFTPDQMTFTLALEDGNWRISGGGAGGGGGTDTSVPGDVTIPDMSVPDPGDVTIPDSDITVPDITVPGGSPGELGSATSPPSGGPDDCFESLTSCEQYADDCFDGDMAACDDLYANTSVGSALEEYGATCGGRLDEWNSRNCESDFG